MLALDSRAGLFLQGLKTSEAVVRGVPHDQSITGQFRAVAEGGGADVHQLDLPNDRRNRVERRRTRNPVFEARARRVGMALDRRRRRGWLASLLVRGKLALRSARGLLRSRAGNDSAQHQA